MEPIEQSLVKILIVDDDAEIRKLVRLWLERADYQVFEAVNGSSALRAVAETHCSLVICDLFMDGKDGIETIQELRQAYTDIKVIAISGGGFKGSVGMLETAKMLGAAASISKPFDRTTLLEAVRSALQ